VDNDSTEVTSSDRSVSMGRQPGK